MKRPSSKLVHAIHQAAEDEIFDARERFPLLESDRKRVQGLARMATTAERALCELDRAAVVFQFSTDVSGLP
jgi:hypothetical protein